jgi:hypothetical protein
MMDGVETSLYNNHNEGFLVSCQGPIVFQDGAG